MKIKTNAPRPAVTDIEIDVDRIDNEVNETEWIALTTGTEGIGYFRGKLVHRNEDNVKRINATSAVPIIRRLFLEDVIGEAINFDAVARWLRAVEAAI